VVSISQPSQDSYSYYRISAHHHRILIAITAYPHTITGFLQLLPHIHTPSQDSYSYYRISAHHHRILTVITAHPHTITGFLQLLPHIRTPSQDSYSYYRISAHHHRILTVITAHPHTITGFLQLLPHIRTTQSNALALALKHSSHRTGTYRQYSLCHDCEHHINELRSIMNQKGRKRKNFVTRCKVLSRGLGTKQVALTGHFQNKSLKCPRLRTTSRLVRGYRRDMSPAVFRIKNDCAGDDQQQFTRPTDLTLRLVAMSTFSVAYFIMTLSET
jgi:hypothetical protein